MKDTTKKSVFFSYSWQDQAIAMRIFYDLTRSNIGVWRDQVDAEKANFDFLDGIFRVIDQLDTFLLIDSPYARNSYFVDKEVKHFYSLLGNHESKKLIICLVGEKKQTHKEIELFARQNLWNYFDFSDIGEYDNDRKYRTNIAKLIEFLDGDFIPWTELPEGEDFEDEISSSKISDEDRISLLRDFETFKLRHQQGFENLDLRLKIIIKDCRRMKIHAVTPFLSLGVLLMEESTEKNNLERLQQAQQIFREASVHFPNDPRVWRGVARTSYYLGDHCSALRAYDEAIKKTVVSENKNFLKHLTWIKEKKAEVLLAANDFESAELLFAELFNEARQKHQLRPEHFTDLSFCFLKNGKFKGCESLLRTGLEHFPNDASIFAELGEFYAGLEDYLMAIFCFEKSVQYAPKRIMFLGPLCNLLYFGGENEKFHHYASRLLTLSPRSSLEYYAVGRVLYFKSDYEKAKQYFEKSNGEIGPYYSELE